MGDTIHRLARRLDARLRGCEVLEPTVGGQPQPGLQGCTVTAVESRGKHLLLWLGAGLAVHLHLGLRGSLHRHPPGQGPATRGPGSVDLRTAGDRIVGLSLRVARLWRPVGDASLGLGPDLLDPRWEQPAWAPAARGRIRGALSSRAALSVGEALLDQAVAAGLGNVYKNELLFLFGLHPRALVGSLSLDRLLEVYERGRRLLRSNLGGGPRTTGPRPLAEPGRPLLQAQDGPQQRVTTWCARCRPAPATRGHGFVGDGDG